MKANTYSQLSLASFVLASGCLFAGCLSLFGGKVVEIGGEGGLTPAQTVAAAEALKDGETLSIKKGVYTLGTNGAKRVFLAPSNNVTGDKDILFPLFGKKNVTVDGNGSTLIISGDAFPFAVLKSEGVTIKNLTIRAKYSPSFSMSMKENRADGVLLKIGEGNVPYEVKDGHLVIKAEKGDISSRNHVISLHAIDRWGVHYLLTPESAPTHDKDKTPAPFCTVVFEDKGNGEVFARYLKDDHKLAAKVPFEAGRQLGSGLAGRVHEAIFFEDCAKSGAENIRIETWGGMGIVSQRSTDMTLRGYKVLPGKGDVCTTSADMMQFIACGGLVTIENCEGQDSLDDVIDIHGNYLGLERWDGTNYVLRAMHGDHFGFFPLRPGDTMSCLVPLDQRKVLGEFVVESWKPDPADPLHLAIVKPKADGRATDAWPRPVKGKETLVENLTLQPDVIFRNNKFTHYPHLRFSGRGKYLIENNRLENAMAAMLILDHPGYWYECGPVKDMTIRNNTFIGCNDQSGSAFITIGAFGDGRPSPKIHSGILLENNTYERVKHQKVIAWAVAGLDNRDEKPAKK